MGLGALCIAAVLRENGASPLVWSLCAALLYLLLPRTLAYLFDDASETLYFVGSISADTTKLFALVPEWSEEPVTNPLPGVLEVEFTRN